MTKDESRLIALSSQVHEFAKRKTYDGQLDELRESTKILEHKIIEYIESQSWRAKCRGCIKTLREYFGGLS